ncbi:Late embryogenesis abundant protein [Macleaya cordata]|uniref:Late embryogenesis abundant protein n=1 Tax=Macleaya cordata TaxID=56857 RepID=A0A200Q0L5_MACCD|nr:Late embryogenesis abundant protein [Macleaya cordata]
MAERIYPSSKPNSNPPQTLNGNTNPTFPPTKSQLYGATRPTYRPQPKRHRRSCCCACFLWSTLVIIALLLIAAIAGAVIYSIYQPKRPSFSLTTLKITQFNITTSKDESFHLNSNLDLIISAKNPNKEVIFFYNPINISVSSNGVDIGDGSLPAFIHGTKNATLLRASITNPPSTILDPVTANSLKSDLKKKSGIPLMIQLNTKVKVKMGGFKTKKVGIEITCDRIRAVAVTTKGSKSNSTIWKFPESSVAKCKVNLRIKIWKWTF